MRFAIFSFIFALHSPHLPWTHSGTYHAFTRLAHRTLAALEALNIHLYFVFDGPTPQAKHDNVLLRGNELNGRAQQFFATSVQGRSTPAGRRGPIRSTLDRPVASGVGVGSGGFMARSPILPAFCFDAFIDVLDKRGYQPGRDIFHIPLGEADAPCVDLAQDLNAWVLANDSDFAIFGFGGSEGYKGFVPIDLISWEVLVKDAEEKEASEDTDFKPVVNRRQRRAGGAVGASHAAGSSPTFLQSLVPPATVDALLGTALNLCCSPESSKARSVDVCLHLTVFTPTALATRLRIPKNQLPLLATIVGTDHSPPELPKLIFSSKLAWHARIDTVAGAIRECLLPGVRARMNRTKKGQLMTVLRPSAVPSTPSSSQTPSVFGDTDGVSAEDSVDNDDDDEAIAFIASVLVTLLPEPHPALNIQPAALLRPIIFALVEATCHYIPVPYSRCCDQHPFCQHCISPSDPKTQVTDGRRLALLQDARTAYASARAAGRLRAFNSYMHLDRVYGNVILENPQHKNGARSEERSRLRAMGWSILHAAVGAHRGINDVEETLDDGSEADADTSVITEYLRVDGSTVIASRPLRLDIDLPPLENDEGRPLCLQDFATRRLFWLRALQSDNARTLALDLPLQPLVALIRFCLIGNHSSGGKLWTSKDILACVTAGLLSLSCWNGDTRVAAAPFEIMNSNIDLENRSCDIVARICSTSIDINGLTSVLLMQDIPGWHPIYQYFEGDIWHRCLNDGPESVDLALFIGQDQRACFDAVVEGLEGQYLAAPKGPVKKVNKSNGNANENGKSKMDATTSRANRYGRLS